MAHANPNPVTTHVLDTSTGQPAAGLGLRLSRKVGEHEDGSFRWETIATQTTNADGRLDAPLLNAEQAPEKDSVYELHFDTAAYFAQQGRKCFYPYVKIVFEIADPASHYHVPLLISPFGQMTYRGS
ncbi:5-hydroxyisourate hydrolase [Hondaea fermentalgiana]|uniref:5-hydroxyisourate hydrolase n=1 Tax=Hondaea fermentalgiana TaxID=2315210 RepID=A0A2R5G2K0_9STRA|nr:5-hydroxyisourate hydrolase [Hondaea fermentalgiana]|eukprot:GBG25257.1 5-hydroxyisourate hydrolase [Hondaea fermentalgiana]